MLTAFAYSAADLESSAAGFPFQSTPLQQRLDVGVPPDKILEQTKCISRTTRDLRSVCRKRSPFLALINIRHVP